MSGRSSAPAFAEENRVLDLPAGPVDLWVVIADRDGASVLGADLLGLPYPKWQNGRVALAFGPARVSIERDGSYGGTFLAAAGPYGADWVRLSDVPVKIPRMLKAQTWVNIDPLDMNITDLS